MSLERCECREGGPVTATKPPRENPEAIVLCRGPDGRPGVVMFADIDAARRLAREKNGFMWGPIAWWEYRE